MLSLVVLEVVVGAARERVVARRERAAVVNFILKIGDR